MATKLQELARRRNWALSRVKGMKALTKVIIRNPKRANYPYYFNPVRSRAVEVELEVVLNNLSELIEETWQAARKLEKELSK